MTCNDLAGVLHDIGEDVKAQRYLKSGIRLCRETGDRSAEVWGIYELAWIYYGRGDLAAALDRFRQVVALSAEIQDLRAEAHALTAIGRVHADLGQHAEASAYYERRLSHARARQAIGR